MAKTGSNWGPQIVRQEDHCNHQEDGNIPGAQSSGASVHFRGAPPTTTTTTAFRQLIDARGKLTCSVGHNWRPFATTLHVWLTQLRPLVNPIQSNSRTRWLLSFSLERDPPEPFGRMRHICTPGVARDGGCWARAIWTGKQQQTQIACY